MKKIKNTLNNSYFMAVLFCIFAYIQKIKADSGFDSDFGGSDSGGSDWGSSSSSDWGSSSSYSGSGGSGSGDPLFVIYFMISFIGLTIYSIVTGNKSAKVKRDGAIIFGILDLGLGFLFFGPYVILYGIVIYPVIFIVLISTILEENRKQRMDENERKRYFSENEFSKYNTEELKQELFNKYKDIQVAWSKNDLEPVRSLLTDELFNTYQFQIDSMIATKQRNEMSDFVFVDMSIKNMSVVNNQEELKVIMQVTCKDYMVKDNNGKETVIRGSSSIINDYIYEMTFVRNIIKNLKYCPNCGNKLKKGMSEKCPYCDGIIIHETEEYVLSKKKMLRQKRK